MRGRARVRARVRACLYLKQSIDRCKLHRDRVTEYLGENGLSYSLVDRWYTEFKRGRPYTKNDPRSGYLTTVVTEEMTCTRKETLSPPTRPGRRTFFRRGGGFEISREVQTESLRSRKALVCDFHFADSLVLMRNLCIDTRLMMELEGGHRNSVIKRRNPIEFWARLIVLTSTLILYGNQRLMMELEGGHRNSVIKRRNPYRVWARLFVLTSTLILYGNQRLMMELEGGQELRGKTTQPHRVWARFDSSLTCTLILYCNQGLMMELEDGQEPRN
ncbi:hypothetical protein EVAR_47291_1 [Eumeta japonica]|uniref:Mos1 transposase HTH domain-containing protein n=1 Tax=Eumeta variegata TaxID=151549 RepID=A0A4C1Z2H4_EUMVA|nr:hypothetical protein EVAR_47291_1 [Eumeta japonica]